MSNIYAVPTPRKSALERRADSDLVKACEADGDLLVRLAEKAYAFRLAVIACRENAERTSTIYRMEKAEHLIDDLIGCHVLDAALELEADAHDCGVDLENIATRIRRAYE